MIFFFILEISLLHTSSLRDIPFRSGKLALQPLVAPQDYCCVTNMIIARGHSISFW
jgi:hypothetical protein